MLNSNLLFLNKPKVCHSERSEETLDSKNHMLPTHNTLIFNVLINYHL